MGLAVIAAEDQKFPEHWGFVSLPLSKPWRTTNAMKTVFACVDDFSADSQKSFFMGWAQLVRKGLEAGLTLGIETVWSKSVS